MIKHAYLLNSLFLVLSERHEFLSNERWTKRKKGHSVFHCFSNAFYNFFGIKIFVFLALWWNQFWNAGLVSAADTCSTRRTLKNRQMAGTEERGRAKGDLLRDRGKVLSSVHLLRGRIYFLTSDPWLKGRLKLSCNSKHSTYFKSVILW